jgi:hypothetical protein
MIITDGEKFYRKIVLALGVAEPALGPAIKPGDTVMIRLTPRQFAPGGIFVVNFDGTQLWCRWSQVPPLFSRLGFAMPN